MKAKATEENPAAREARLAKAFAAVQATATSLELSDEARRKFAEATLLAADADTRRGAGDAAGAVEEWAKALAGAGPVVLEAVVARYEREAGALRQLRLEDQAAPVAQALRGALGASEDAAARGEFCGGGLLYQWRVDALSELAPDIRRQDQTLAVFGVPEEQIRDLVSRLAGRGIDRVVPIGHALNFGRFWDGYDLYAEFTRRVAVTVGESDG